MGKQTKKTPWSLVYKIVSDKLQKPTVWTALKLPDGRITAGLDETIKALLNKCVPKDDVTVQGEECETMRQKLHGYKNSNLEKPIPIAKIKSAIDRFKNNKAPGMEELWKRKPQVILNLFNNSFTQGSYPKSWKQANIKIILKDEKRDRTLLNSYRPIALLSVVRKIFEKVIVERVQLTYREKGLESPRQFGFRQGRGTNDAFICLRRAIKQNDRKYSVILFVDIEGAFDSLWWSAVLTRIVEANCSTQMLNIIKSYFKNRKATIQCRTKSYSTKMQKGCPQGSIIGPAAWGWCMDTLLNELHALAEHVEVIAYADDLACLIKGNTRTEVQTHATKV